MNTKQLKAIAPKPTVDIKKLPSEFEGILTGESMETDSYGTECLFWEIAIGNEVFKQKYSPTQIGTLAQALEILHVADTKDLIGKNIAFKKSLPSGRNEKEFPRWFPVAIL